MATRPRLSILVPAYNVEPYVREALDSALDQVGTSVEVVVVDDGATDGTPAILDAYAAAHPDRVVLVRQANRGLAGARNTALAHATGEFVGLLDADDAWEPERAARCVEFLDAHPGLDAVTTDARLLHDRTPTELRYYADHFTGQFPAPDAQLAAIAAHNFVFVGAVLRRDLLARIGGFDERLRRAEDYDLWCRVLLAGARFGFVDAPLARYRLRPDSLSADAVAQWEAHLSVLAKHFDALVGAGVRPDPMTCDALARRFAAEGDRRRSAAAFAAAARGTIGRDPLRGARLFGLALRSFVTPPGRSSTVGP